MHIFLECCIQLTPTSSTTSCEVDIWNKTDALAEKFRSVNLVTDFVIPVHLNVGEISSQLQLVARLIRLRDLRSKGINCDVIYCIIGGFDAHFHIAEVMETNYRALITQFHPFGER